MYKQFVVTIFSLLVCSIYCNPTPTVTEPIDEDGVSETIHNPSEEALLDSCKLSF